MVVSTNVGGTLRMRSPADLKGLVQKRLNHLLRLRREHEEELNQEGIRLLDRAIFSAFLALSEIVGRKEASSFLESAVGAVPGVATKGRGSR